MTSEERLTTKIYVFFSMLSTVPVNSGFCLSCVCDQDCNAFLCLILWAYVKGQGQHDSCVCANVILLLSLVNSAIFLTHTIEAVWIFNNVPAHVSVTAFLCQGRFYPVAGQDLLNGCSFDVKSVWSLLLWYRATRTVRNRVFWKHVINILQKVSRTELHQGNMLFRFF